MSQGQINSSAGKEGIHTPGHELDAQPTPISFQVQALQDFAVWAGAQAEWFKCQSPSPSAPWLPSVTYRTNFRKRYQQYTMSWSWPSFSSSYSGSMVQTGAGNKPVITGIPNHIDAGGGQTGSFQFVYTEAMATLASTPSGQGYYYGSNIGPGFTWSDVIPASINGNQGGPNYTDPASTYTVGGYLNFPVANSTGLQSWSYSFTNETTFGVFANTAFTRIQARSFPTFVAGQTNPEAWDDWPTAAYYFISMRPVTDPPANWTDATFSIVQADFVPPFFGINPATYPANAYCWSGWYVDFQEEDGNAPSAVGDTANGIYCRRSRFKPPASGLNYFIASCQITRAPRDLGIPFNEWDSVPISRNDDLVNVSVISTGTTTLGTIIEVPWPSNNGSGDFIQVALPVQGNQTLTYGAMNFAIVGETPAQWTTRTGIPHT